MTSRPATRSPPAASSPHRLDQLVEQARRHAPLRTVVVHPVDAVSLMGAIEAERAGLITPVLVGPERRIRAAARAARIDLTGRTIVATEHSHAAAAQAVQLARRGEADAIMKGALHTDELMHCVIDPDCGLRTERRVSHIFAIDAPHYPRLLFITDAAVNIYPSLEDKRDIVQNAIDLARALGVRTPHVALLSAVELVTPKIKSTLDAAALCKMADRGQITGGILDGPLAFDNAVSRAAAATKAITSRVAGRADIFVVPDLEAGNMLAKQLEYLAGARLAGIVLGARVPIMLTSRADDARSRLASCAIATLYAARAGKIRRLTATTVT
jgi:phosphate acetyltransferase/phosphate butyryltransferase